MNILAIDASTKSTGIAYFEDKKLKEVKCITASSTDLVKRIYKMSSEICNFLSENKVDKIIMEEVIPKDRNDDGSQKNLKTMKALMYLQAQLNFMVHDNYPKINIEYVYPSEWRAGCGISTGRGVKRESLKVKDIEFVKSKYKLELNDDEADAVCIGHFYVNKTDDEDLNWG